MAFLARPLLRALAPRATAVPRAVGVVLAPRSFHTTSLKSSEDSSSGRLFGSAPIADAEAISHIAFAFMGSKVLFTALDIGVFTTLSPSHGTDNGYTLQELAAKLELPERRLTTIMTALHSMGLVARAPDMKYTNVPATEAFLVRGAKYDFGDYLRFQIDKQMYPFMDHLASVVKGTASKQKFADYAEWFSDPEEARLYTESQHSGSVGPARSLAKMIPDVLSSSTSLLDVGGGSGGFSMTLAQLFPNLKPTVLDFPNVCKVGEEFLAKTDPFVGDQVSFLPGNALETAYPSGQDLVLMSYISGSISGDDVVKMYKSAFDCMAPGGTVIVHDFMVEDSRDGPPLAALWACQHMIFTPGGVSLTPAFVAEQLEQAGFVETRTAEMIPGLTKGVLAKKPEA